MGLVARAKKTLLPFGKKKGRGLRILDGAFNQISDGRFDFFRSLSSNGYCDLGTYSQLSRGFHSCRVGIYRNPRTRARPSQKQSKH